MNKLLCPTCNQDLNEPPHKGLLDRDCPQCGQGIMWRFARRVERANKASTPTAGTRRQNSKSKSKKATVKQAGSPSGG